MGSFEVTADEWSEPRRQPHRGAAAAAGGGAQAAAGGGSQMSACSTRAVRYMHRVGSALVKQPVSVSERQLCTWLRGGGLVLHVRQDMDGIPFADCFHVDF